MHENEISYAVRKAAYDVHVALGPGLLESAYEGALLHELRLTGLQVQNQVALPMVYKDVRLDVGYRLDLLIENKVIVELKTVDALLDVHHMQLLTYLKLTGCKLGLLINFNVPRIKEGIFRKVNGLTD
ncbi:GxxExxY protein [Hymenobacter saemangeumensis]|uniref:GxxExxY protein n=1 Tax=Hymenobacter saemangeumensis TaxID=1084522 RepID=A0ABP8I5P3_9BACT